MGQLGGAAPSPELELRAVRIRCDELDGGSLMLGAEFR
jgi:hypothetical protein